MADNAQIGDQKINFYSKDKKAFKKSNNKIVIIKNPELNILSIMKGSHRRWNGRLRLA